MDLLAEEQGTQHHTEQRHQIVAEGGERRAGLLDQRHVEEVDQTGTEGTQHGDRAQGLGARQGQAAEVNHEGGDQQQLDCRGDQDIAGDHDRMVLGEALDHQQADGEAAGTQQDGHGTEQTGVHALGEFRPEQGEHTGKADDHGKQTGFGDSFTRNKQRCSQNGHKRDTTHDHGGDGAIHILLAPGDHDEGDGGIQQGDQHIGAPWGVLTLEPHEQAEQTQGQAAAQGTTGSHQNGGQLGNGLVHENELGTPQQANGQQ
ncbi:hypothetical protein AERO8C_70160 [Aeromonas veronii]|uniref:Uncharacterized protein n=1 Tax=Aeromonas veronii TaxID=654 RepID=A0A653LCE4_AERVE|nr:hypothetical protein AERO8C_70160 [Aeromonas veronii]